MLCQTSDGCSLVLRLQLFPFLVALIEQIENLAKLKGDLLKRTALL